MIDFTMLSGRYSVRALDDSDLDEILNLCLENPQFYQYCEAQPTAEQIRMDMQTTPSGIDRSSKYYVGFYQECNLVAIMDLIDGYPKKEIGYIGFFMMNKQYQGKNIGTALFREIEAYLKATGKTALRLAIDKGNPQSTHFWKKNGFSVIAEVEINGWTKLVAEKVL